VTTEGIPDLAAIVAAELALPRAGVEQTLALFAGGATVPFIARYRKEATGGLDEVMIGQIKERHEYQVQLEARRKTILDSIGTQGKLTGDLRARILATRSKTELEDLYLPYKPKRRTKAAIAGERGLEPLADLVWAQAMRLEQPREARARPFVDAAKGVPDVEWAWQGARDIVAERIAEDADVRASLRDLALAEGRLASRVAKGKEQKAKKFEDYYLRDDVTEFEHLKEGMVLAGVVTNVTAFGAFVDVGVHQDGLVHVSELANRFVRDPAEIAKVGDRVRVKVIKIDGERRRIGLSLKQTGDTS
jgi:uncharacterized protein